MLPHDPDEELRYQRLQEVSADAAEQFLTALRDPSWRVRRRAAERLVELPHTAELVSRLIAVLAARDETGARNAAAEALVGIGAEAVPALLALLGHADPDQRKFAADILGLIGPRAGARRMAPVEEALAAALDDEDANVRVSAAEALGLVGDAQAAPALQRALQREDLLLQLASLTALTRLKSPPPLQELMRLMQAAALRPVCLRALGLLDDPAARSEILRALGDETPRAVFEAALAAVSLTPETQTSLQLMTASQRDRLVHALSDSEDEETRRGALRCLSLAGDPLTAPALAEAAEDDRLAEDALSALLRLGPAGARVLAERMETMSGPSRVVAAEAIVRCADASLLPALLRMLESAEPELQSAAVTALGRTRSAEALAPLTNALREPALSVRAAAALVQLDEVASGEVRRILHEAASQEENAAALHALVELEGPATLPLLRTAAKSVDARMRAAAARATAMIGGESSTALLRTLLSDESSQVRAAAARAVGRTKDADVATLLGPLLSDEDEDPSIQEAALEAAGEAAPPELLPRLRELAGSPRAALAIGALKALSRMKGLAGDVLLRAADHPEPEVVREALVLGAAQPEAVAIARRLLAHGRWELRVAAARVLGDSGGAADLPRVTEALEREGDPLVRDALEQARVQLGRR